MRHDQDKRSRIGDVKNKFWPCVPVQRRVKGVEHFLRHMGSDPKLIHAFPVLRPDLPESERVIDEIIEWFRKQEK